MSRVLLVDDEESILTILTHYLKKSFDEVITASNGKEALELCDCNEFDLILSDISMPIMTGVEFLESLREKDQETPFIFVSAYGNQSEDLLSRKELCLHSFIDKPVDKTKLLSIIRPFCSVQNSA